MEHFRLVPISHMLQPRTARIKRVYLEEGLEHGDDVEQDAGGHAVQLLDQLKHIAALQAAVG